MSRSHSQEKDIAPRQWVLVIAAVLLAVGGLLAGCSSSHQSVRSSASSVSSNSAGSARSLNSIASKLQGSADTPYEAIYTSSGGSSPTKTLEFAESPPDNFAFIGTAANGSKTELISTARLSVSCTQTGASWTCVQLPRAQVAAFTRAFQIYKSSYWTKILGGMKSAATGGGLKVTTSTRTLAGQHLQCITYSGRTAGAGGELCVTNDGVLGYVHNAASNTTFQLVSYSTSPPPSVFALPPGATVRTTP
jgi:outer membrane murein-binding lipoprotein Lpp